MHCSAGRVDLSRSLARDHGRSEHRAVLLTLRVEANRESPSPAADR